MVLPTTTGLIADRLGAELIGPPGLEVAGLEAIERAGPTDLTFIRSRAFASAWPDCRAGAALVSKSLVVPGHDASTRALLRVPDADLALIHLLRLLSPKSSAISGVHPSACIDATARVDAAAFVGPFCVIGPGTTVGAGATLHPRVTLGREVSIGSGTTIHSGCVVQDRCAIGRECTLHPNVVIGADGFGFRPAPDGSGILKVPHLGSVVIGDRVEIGSSTCIDRAKFGATTIGDETKIDNLVQVGHNCRIGRACLICGKTGLAGSVTLEDGVIIGAGAGLADGITIGAGARIAGAAMVSDDVPAGEAWLGYRAGPAKKAMANLIAFGDLAEHVRTLRRLEQRLDSLRPPPDA